MLFIAFNTEFLSSANATHTIFNTKGKNPT